MCTSKARQCANTSQLVVYTTNSHTYQLVLPPTRTVLDMVSTRPYACHIVLSNNIFYGPFLVVLGNDYLSLSNILPVSIIQYVLYFFLNLIIKFVNLIIKIDI